MQDCLSWFVVYRVLQDTISNKVLCEYRSSKSCCSDCWIIDWLLYYYWRELGRPQRLYAVRERPHCVPSGPHYHFVMSMLLTASGDTFLRCFSSKSYVFALLVGRLQNHQSSYIIGLARVRACSPWARQRSPRSENYCAFSPPSFAIFLRVCDELVDS